MRLVLALALLGACDTPQVIVAWNVTNLATGEHKKCLHGATTARLRVRTFDEYLVSSLSGGTRWAPSGEERIDSFPCGDGVGWTDAPIENHETADGIVDTGEGEQIIVELTDDRDRVVASSLPTFVRPSTTGVVVDLIEDGGYMTFPWAWWGFMPFSMCDGAARLRVNIEGVSSVNAEIIECSGFFPIRPHLHPSFMATQPLPAGEYRMWTDKLDASWGVTETRSWGTFAIGTNNDIAGIAAANP